MKSRLIEFGMRVREARLSASLSQPELARRLGKSKQLVSAWEKGRAEMLTMTLADLASATGADINWLLRGGVNPNVSGVKKPPPRGSVVPLLTAADAIKVARGKFSLDEAPTQIYTCEKAGARAFALEVADNSMRPDLVAGDIIVCAPDHRVAPGGIVAAVVKRSGCGFGRAGSGTSVRSLQVCGYRRGAVRTGAAIASVAGVVDPQAFTRGVAWPGDHGLQGDILTSGGAGAEMGKASVRYELSSMGA